MKKMKMKMKKMKMKLKKNVGTDRLNVVGLEGGTRVAAGAVHCGLVVGVHLRAQIGR